MVKTIKMNLSQDSIQSAIKQLEKYKKQIGNKNRAMVDKLAKLGEEYVQENSKYTENDPGTTSHKTVQNGTTATSEVLWKGEQITFIEFGAGVYFNDNPHGSPHPKGVEMGMTIGDYGYHQGLKESWKKPDGEWTHGTPALMPMWRAINSEDGIAKMVPDVAREVFDK